MPTKTRKKARGAHFTANMHEPEPLTHQSGVSARLVVQAVVKVVVAAWEAYHAVATTVHEGQGGDGGIHLIISASSNKHHPMSQAQTKTPLADLSTQVAETQSPTNTPKLLLDLHSHSTLTVHI